MCYTIFFFKKTYVPFSILGIVLHIHTGAILFQFFAHCASSSRDVFRGRWGQQLTDRETKKTPKKWVKWPLLNIFQHIKLYNKSKAVECIVITMFFQKSFLKRYILQTICSILKFNGAYT